MRTATQEVMEQVSLRLTAQLAEASRRLTRDAPGEERSPAMAAKRVGAMLATLRKLRLKPKKARLKDLERIEQTVDKLLELTAPEP
ncbi:MAG: hypothetical protein JW940_27015 [Polyangiaceae bacterium]|nr:hypothetical protein [Polyangiaceae bacterium]